MMGEKKFRVNDLVKFNYSEVGEYVDENHTDRPLRNDEVVDLLNEQQATITALKEENEQLQAQLREKEEDERLYANEIVKLNKEAKEVLDFKSLGGDY